MSRVVVVGGRTGDSMLMDANVAVGRGGEESEKGKEGKSGRGEGES